MRRSALDEGIRGQFAGHETFPLRLLWLKKAYDVAKGGTPSGTFQEQDAIARFGVGRNMAVSMRHWALASGFFTDEARWIEPTPLGHILLADDGLDPYLEQPATIWLAHWHIASTPLTTTTIYYAFNGFGALEFSPANLVDELMAIVEARKWRATRGTLKRDVEVFLRGYVRRNDVQHEDAAEPLLAELGLVRETKIGGWYEFARGPKPSLPASVFAYALDAYWCAQGRPNVLTAEQLCYGPGSPGQVFKLDEDSVITRLMAIDETTGGAWRWTDTSGLRQIQKIEPFDPMPLLKHSLTREPILEPAA